MAYTPTEEALLSLTEADAERFRRYERAWMYYKAEEYLGELGREYAKERKLFRAMRHVFGAVTQCVDTDARFTMKRRISIEAEDKFKQDILDIWDRSNLQVEKYKLARYGSNLGDAFLIVQDLGSGGTVVPQIVVANSEDMTVYTDPDDQNQILRAKQSYNFIGADGRPHTRDWIYWPDRVERYTDGKRDDERPHAFGEVPVVHIRAIDIGEAYGLSSWHNVQGQLDEVNELGSYTNRILLRYAQPDLVASGMQPGEKPVMRKGLREDNVYYLTNPEARLSILEYQGDVLPHILAQIQEIAANIQDELPELSLAKIREQSGLSGYAVSLHAADLLAKIEELRGNFGNGIEWANALCLRAIRRSKALLEEFVNHVEYEPAFPVDRLEQLQAWQAEKDLGIAGPKTWLRRDGLSEDEIAERLQEVEDSRGAAGFGLGRLAADAGGQAVASSGGA